MTYDAPFSAIKSLLSTRPLRRPAKYRRIDNETLKRLASEHPPPKEWFSEEADGGRA